MREIALTQGQVAIVSDDDYERLTQHRWSVLVLHPHRRIKRMVAGRIVRSSRTKSGHTTVYMHRQIMNAPDGAQVDHINGNSLDNRRENLRFATNSENRANAAKHSGRSQYKGVTRDHDRWRARIVKDRRVTNIGTFSSEVEAALAYDARARVMFGPFARVNLGASV